MINRYKFEFTIFFTGVVIMVLELTASRIIAPLVGNSIYVWTSLIGIMLGALGIGYFVAGRIPARELNEKNLAYLLLVAIVYLVFIGLIKDIMLEYIQRLPFNVHIIAPLVTFVMFALPSVILGIIYPYLVRLKTHSIVGVGKTVGNFSALSICGNILGTFAAGYFLIPFVGSTYILFVLSFLLLTCVTLLIFSKKIFICSFVFVFIFLALLYHYAYTQEKGKWGIVEVDSTYNHLTISTGVHKENKRPVRFLLTGKNLVHAAIYLDNNETLEPKNLWIAALLRRYHTNPKRVLIIGGGALILPNLLLKDTPSIKIDVVEIDPKMTEVAREFFNFNDDRRVTLFHTEGRNYVNSVNHVKYDAVIMDAFSSYEPPFQLTTRQFVEKLHDLTTKDAVILINNYGSIYGENGRITRSLYLTYKTAFGYVSLYPVNNNKNTSVEQNIILVASKSVQSSATSNFNVKKFVLSERELEPDVVLTDEYAPVEMLTIGIGRNVSPPLYSSVSLHEATAKSLIDQALSRLKVI